MTDIEHNLNAAVDSAWRTFNRAHAESTAAYLETGALLIEAKASQGHGEWLPWLADRGIPARQAQRMITLAASGLKCDTAAYLGIRLSLDCIATNKAEAEHTINVYGRVGLDVSSVRDLQSFLEVMLGERECSIPGMEGLQAMITRDLEEAGVDRLDRVRDWAAHKPDELNAAVANKVLSRALGDDECRHNFVPLALSIVEGTTKLNGCPEADAARLTAETLLGIWLADVEDDGG